MNKLFSTIMSVCLACNVQATDLFKTSQDIALRARPYLWSLPILISLSGLPTTNWTKGTPNTGQPPSFTGCASGRRESISFHGQGQAKSRNNPSDDKHRTLGSKVHHEPTGSQLDTAPVRWFRMDQGQSRFRHQRHETHRYRVEHRRHLGTP